jgi:hypothetical protein
LFTTLKAGDNNHFCHVFELPNWVKWVKEAIIDRIVKALKLAAQLHMQLRVCAIKRGGGGA